MKIVDLSHLINSEMPVYPGTKQPELMKAFTMIRDGFEETEINIYSHVGTHMDAPRHLISNGKTLDEYPIDSFIGSAKVVELDVFNQLSEEEVLSQFKGFDYVLFKTDSSEQCGALDYFVFQTPKHDLVKALCTLPIKGVGIDAISIDDFDSETFKNHHMLLSNEILIIENLTDLQHVPSEFEIIALPLKFDRSDGSPTRVVARFKEEE